MKGLRIILIKPSKYAPDGSLERFKAGFMPNATLYHIASLTPETVNGVPITIEIIDEYVRDDLDYLELLKVDPNYDTLLAVVGVQSHQFHRALDLTAFAMRHGIRHCIIGGPHTMTCNTEQFHGRGVSFALAEAEIIWEPILFDAVSDELKPTYGEGNRWAKRLDGPIITPPDKQAMQRYWSPLLGLYPVRGCPYRCSYCSVIKISGRQLRSTAVEVTIESLRRAEKAGVELIMFVSDNFNKYPEVRELLEAMIEEKFNLRFFCQCDAQIARQPELVELLGRANCYEMFIGIESFNREALKATKKFHNKPDHYHKIVSSCKKAGIRAHFSNIIGFPEDNEEEILHTLNTIMSLDPARATFHILTPIPGTEQYDEYLGADKIWEKNLDRFDATCLTWSHPSLSAEKLSELLHKCHRKFYGAYLRNNDLAEDDRNIALFNRYAAGERMHPLSGGTGRVFLDHVDDYKVLRSAYFDIDLAPLPSSLRLSAADEVLNEKIQLKTSFTPATV
jgi:pyruvate-formate lyase-activating enzyme